MMKTPSKFHDSIPSIKIKSEPREMKPEASLLFPFFPLSRMNIFLAISISFFFITSFSSAINPSNNITFLGDAFLNSSTIILTKERKCTAETTTTTPSDDVGSAFYGTPFRFLDTSANTIASSFSTSFSFTITNTDSCPFGDGFAFLITSADQDSRVAVKFDTSFSPNFSGDHIAIDVNTIKPLAWRSVDLRSRKEMAARIRYRNSVIKVWMGYPEEIRDFQNPFLTAQIDLSKHLKEFMNVGFTASSGRGSSTHSIRKWRFKTFLRSSSTPLTSIDLAESEDCVMCSETDTQIGSLGYRRRILKLGLILGCSAIVIILIAIVTAIVCVWCLRRKLRKARTERKIPRIVPKMLSLNQIRSATNGFDHDRIIGEGASAVVYAGAIPNHGAVAIKRFNQEDKFDPSMARIPFNTELATMMGCLRHRNLVQLRGWCCERNELVLVYEYMAKGSLDKILHNHNSSKILTWERRLNIILGVASALIYLHEECESQIIHRDVKTCNILLDKDLNPKLGDFGLAEVYERSIRARSATVPAGTMGYLAPEYVYSGVPTVKSDVYSFGVVVLEVSTGRRPVDEDRTVITDYVWDLWEKGMICEAADPKLRGRFDKAEMQRTLMVGLCCAHPDYEKRPTVRAAARMMRGESPQRVLPPMKPTMRIQSVLPEGCEEIMSFGGGDYGDTPWTTPATHFSKY